MKVVCRNFGTLRKKQIYVLHSYKKKNPWPIAQIREENFPKVREDVNKSYKKQTKHQIHRTRKRKSPQHNIIKTLKIAKKERLLKATKRKQQLHKKIPPTHKSNS